MKPLSLEGELAGISLLEFGMMIQMYDRAWPDINSMIKYFTIIIIGFIYSGNGYLAIHVWNPYTVYF